MKLSFKGYENTALLVALLHAAYPRKQALGFNHVLSYKIGPTFFAFSGARETCPRCACLALHICFVVACKREKSSADFAGKVLLSSLAS